MVEFQGTKEAVALFKEVCARGELVADDGQVQIPWFMVDWSIWLDGEKAQRPVFIPADNQEHLIQFYGPKGYGHMWHTVRMRPALRAVS